MLDEMNGLSDSERGNDDSSDDKRGFTARSAYMLEEEENIAHKLECG